MQWLLDTNAVTALLNEPAGRLAQRLRQHPPSTFGLSAIVMHELYFGAYKSRQRERNLIRVDGLQLEVIPFDQEDARQAGAIRATLAQQGMPIGSYDALIAGQALARRLGLITRNVREFGRVNGLRVENWED